MNSLSSVVKRDDDLLCYYGVCQLYCGKSLALPDHNSHSPSPGARAPMRIGYNRSVLYYGDVNPCVAEIPGANAPGIPAPPPPLYGPRGSQCPGTCQSLNIKRFLSPLPAYIVTYLHIAVLLSCCRAPYLRGKAVSYFSKGN
jgi:hypothetical protein